METLKTAEFFNYRNGEFLQFAKNTGSIFTAFDLVALLLANRFAAFQVATEALNSVFQPILSSELTPDLTLLDTRRDKAIMGIKTYLDSQEFREEVDVVAAAQLLKANFASHGDRVDKLSYQQETAVVNAMLDDWKTGSLATAVITLKLDNWIALLQNINTEFDAKYIDRAQSAPQPADIEAKRAVIIQSYNELTNDVIAYSRIAADKVPYLKIINGLNGLIDDYNTAAHQRLAGRGTDTEGTTTPPETPPQA